MSELSARDNCIVWSLINFYEFIFGFLLGLVLNEISYKIFPFKKNEGIFTTILLVLALGVMSINLVLYLRYWVETLPGLKEYNLSEINYPHPPPVALTFGFWITHRQLKARNRSIQQYIFKLIGSPIDV